QAGGGGGGAPELVAEPSAGDVSVGIEAAGLAGVVDAGGAALGAVAGIGTAAVVAAAAAGGVAGQGAVPVVPPVGGGVGQRVRRRRRGRLRTRRAVKHGVRGEQQVTGVEGVLVDVAAQGGGEVGADPQPAVFAIFRVF